VERVIFSLRAVIVVVVALVEVGIGKDTKEIEKDKKRDAGR